MAFSPVPKTLLALVGSAALLIAAPTLVPQDTESEFPSSTIDIGMVVRDVEKSVEFYTDLIGFTEVPGFAVNADFATGAGLTDGHGVKIHVLVLKKDRTATNLKLMSLPDAKPAASDNEFVHSQLGLSYLTIRTVSLAPALERLKAAGITPLADGPVPLPGAGADGPHLVVVRDPDGNLVELIGTL